MDAWDDISANPALPPRPARRDALTILRILLLTGGVAVGITVFGPERDAIFREWKLLANAAVIGLSLPAPLIVMAAARRGQAIGHASLLAMTLGCGALLLLPPAALGAILSHNSTGPMCLYYVMPQVALWFLLAALLTGQINRRLFDRLKTPWIERYGYFLALLWSPLGILHLVNFYREALGGGHFE